MIRWQCFSSHTHTHTCVNRTTGLDWLMLMRKGHGSGLILAWPPSKSRNLKFNRWWISFKLWWVAIKSTRWFWAGNQCFTHICILDICNILYTNAILSPKNSLLTNAWICNKIILNFFEGGEFFWLPFDGKHERAEMRVIFKRAARSCLPPLTQHSLHQLTNSNCSRRHLIERFIRQI